MVGAAITGGISASAKIEGEHLARNHCAACHQFPEPDLLTKRSWEYALTYMGFFLGIDDRATLSRESERTRESISMRKEFVETAGLFPQERQLTDEQWAAIRAYYLANAPTAPLPQVGKNSSVRDTEGFKPMSTSYGPSFAITSLVYIDEGQGIALVFDARLGRLTVLDSSLRIVESHRSPGVTLVEAERVGEDRLRLLSVGDLFASEVGAKRGELQEANASHGELSGLKVLLEGLHRPVDALWADLDEDGAEDLVVSNFGEYTGSLSLYPGIPAGGLKKSPQLLSSEPGVVKSEAHDFDGDGQLDLIVAASHAWENISLYRNVGDLNFERTVLVEKHPAFGYVDLELGDFNGDGVMDFLTVNGDNGDSDPYNTLKRDHGIRVYHGEGNGKFHEAFFYPMYGAFGAEVQDFDGDGDLDIAAIAYHPNFRTERPEGFVYLEQEEEGLFAPRRVEAAQTGRWLTIDSGDLDGDGDPELILGAAYLPVGVPAEQEERFAETARRGPAILVLENRFSEL